MMDILYTLMRRYPADFIITGRGSGREGRQSGGLRKQLIHAEKKKGN